ncbi:hypothetical protein WR25_19983 isoform A [Diploscapter pachys]|uniref:K Homology domain-containing protein n=1 Tax=Diploscapter pachys TaxID=2018661 RepID=A0A2A2KV88_9BILA|nr:hypothetical protein WR25_19983 isoform A [Diploscapter pachys]
MSSSNPSPNRESGVAPALTTDVSTVINTTSNLKRQLDDYSDQNPAKRANMQGMGMEAGMVPFGMMGGGGPNDQVSDIIQVPDNSVGLVIGRGGSEIQNIQTQSGARVQMAQESDPGTGVRNCTIQGSRLSVDRARQLIQNVIDRANQRQMQGGQGGGNQSMGGGMMSGAGDGRSIAYDYMIPAAKCGLVIGKQGETIKLLQEQSGAKMQMIQDTQEVTGQPKPLRIQGDPDKVELGKRLITELLAREEGAGMNAGSGGGGGGGHRFHHEGGGGGGGQGGPTAKGEVVVPRASVGMIIGKGGEMIKRLAQETGTKIQFKPDEDQSSADRTAIIMGTREQIYKATELITELVHKSLSGGGTGGGGNAGGGPMHNTGNQQEVFYMHVPANKTGLVIGKGGETIKQINSESGAYCELSREPPPNAQEKVFIIKGTPYQIHHAQHIIRIKVGDIAPGTPVPFFAGPGGPMANASFGAAPAQFNGGYGAQQVPQWNAGYGHQPDTGNGWAQQPAAAPAQPYYGAQPAAAAQPQATFAPHQYQTPAAQQYAAQPQPAQAAQPAQPAAAATQQAAPSINPQTGQPDYSAQWAEYYRSMGMHDQAAVIEAQMKQQRGATGTAQPAQATYPQAAGTQPGAAPAQAQQPYAAYTQPGQPVAQQYNNEVSVQMNLPRLCFAIHKEFLLSSAGPSVDVYEIGDDLKRISRIRVFEKGGNDIYGMEGTLDGVFVFGERFIALIDDAQISQSQELPIQFVKCTGDFVTALRPFDNGQVAILYGSNNVLLANYSTKSGGLEFTADKEIHCNHQGGISCGLISGTSWTNCCCIVGTALGEILAWHPAFGPEIRIRMNKHHGMIFKLFQSDHFLYSISDDRSLRVWPKIGISAENGNVKFSKIPQEIDSIKDVMVHQTRPWALLSVPVSPMEDLIYTGSMDGLLYTFQMKQKKDSDSGSEQTKWDLQLSSSRQMGHGEIRAITRVDKFLYLHLDDKKILMYGTQVVCEGYEFKSLKSSSRSNANGGRAAVAWSGRHYAIVSNQCRLEAPLDVKLFESEPEEGYYVRDALVAGDYVLIVTIAGMLFLHRADGRLSAKIETTKVVKKSGKFVPYTSFHVFDDYAESEEGISQCLLFVGTREGGLFTALVPMQNQEGVIHEFLESSARLQRKLCREPICDMATWLDCGDKKLLALLHETRKFVTIIDFPNNEVLSLDRSWHWQIPICFSSDGPFPALFLNNPLTPPGKLKSPEFVCGFSSNKFCAVNITSGEIVWSLDRSTIDKMWSFEIVKTKDCKLMGKYRFLQNEELHEISSQLQAITVKEQSIHTRHIFAAEELHTSSDPKRPSSTIFLSVSIDNSFAISRYDSETQGESFSKINFFFQINFKNNWKIIDILTRLKN